MSTALDTSPGHPRPVVARPHRKPVGSPSIPRPRDLSGSTSSTTQSPPSANAPFTQSPTAMSTAVTSPKQYTTAMPVPSSYRANSMQQYQTPYQQQQQLNQQASIPSLPKLTPQYYPPPPPPPSSLQPGPQSQSQAVSSQQLPPQQQLMQQMQPRLPPSQQLQQQMQPQQPPPLSARRTLSNATSSTASSTNQPNNMLASHPSFTSSIRRSTSSRSTTNATSYVALMRKQKATVWCDRAQLEDPRVQAQLKLAKQRAQRELAGGPRNGGRSSGNNSGGLAGGVRNKIRHHGAVKANPYSANLTGAGVPIRLSASEVDEDDDSSEDEREAMIANYARNSQQYQQQIPLQHERNSSGRSSMGSNTRLGSMGFTKNRTSYSVDNAQSPPAGHDEETPMPPPDRKSSADDPTSSGYKDYFAQPKRSPGGQPGSDESGGSNGSIGAEKDFGRAVGLPQRQQQTSQGGDGNSSTANKSADELRRRGSVDDRTMTMTAGRLFIANPDSDSD